MFPEAPGFTTGFQWGSCCSIFSILCTGFTTGFQWGSCCSIFSFLCTGFTTGFQWGLCCSIFSFLCNVLQNICAFVLFLLSICLSFFDLRLLLTPLVILSNPISLMYRCKESRQSSVLTNICRHNGMTCYKHPTLYSSKLTWVFNDTFTNISFISW